MPKPKGMIVKAIFRVPADFADLFNGLGISLKLPYVEAAYVTFLSGMECADWGPKVDVVGFCFLNLAQDYKPPDQLVEWLAAGPAPIYVGFGSLVSLSYYSHSQ